MSSETGPGSPKKRRPVVLLLLAALVACAALVVWECLALLLPQSTQTRLAAAMVRLPIPGTERYGTGAAYSSDATGPTVYANDTYGGRYYAEAQITPANVRQLKVAWTTSTGDARYFNTTSQLGSSLGFECSPVICAGRLIVITPTEQLMAFDPSSGARLWRFTPDGYAGTIQVNRGPSCWVGPPTDPHPYRILYSYWRYLYEVDALTGEAIASFGDHGRIDLSAGISRGHPELVRYNSPSLVVGDTVICGEMIDDDVRSDAPYGTVQAFDVQTGRPRWSFDPIARGQNEGAGNVWSMMSFDPVHRLIYLPTGSASNDSYGGTRPGKDLYSDCIVCLHAETGTMAWYFQFVHHDLWDRDCPSEPLLFDMKRGSTTVPAVAVSTKMGRVFLFDRVSGAPLFPIEEVPVQQSDVPGEVTWPTQPMQSLPPPLVPQSFRPEDTWGVDARTASTVRHAVSQLRTGAIYDPPSLQGTVRFPGNYGGCNWAGMTFDRRDGLIITTTTSYPFIIRLIRASESDKRGPFPMHGTPYYALLSEGTVGSVPICKPPWGTLVAIDPARGSIRWQRPLGYIPQAAGAPGYQSFGSPTVGGAITTATGITFVAGTRDGHLRAIDSATGKDIAQFALPGIGGALPIVYTVDGREYVLICCGGHGFLDGQSFGDKIVAFRL